MWEVTSLILAKCIPKWSFLSFSPKMPLTTIGPIHSMAEIFKTQIENLEQFIPPSVLSRNNRKSEKGSMKSKAVTFGDSEDKHKIKKVLPVPL